MTRQVGTTTPPHTSTHPKPPPPIRRSPLGPPAFAPPPARATIIPSLLPPQTYTLDGISGDVKVDGGKIKFEEKVSTCDGSKAARGGGDGCRVRRRERTGGGEAVVDAAPVPAMERGAAAGPTRMSGGEGEGVEWWWSRAGHP